MEREPTRYELVSRRALLKASAGFGVVFVLPVACSNGDTEVFAGAVTDAVSPASAQTPTPVPTTEPLVPTVESIDEAAADPAAAAADSTAAPEPAAAAEPNAVPESAEPAAAAEPTAVPESAEPEVAAEPTAVTESAEPEAAGDSTAVPEPEVAAEPTAVPLAVPAFAVAGEMVIAFTYTQGAGGKNERPYIAVWIENAAGELAQTVSLWYEQGRRGERWLDHLDRWWAVDQSRIISGGTNNAATISSATRSPGSYSVAWDGNINGVKAAAGTYYICVEAAREEGPYSLVRQPFELTGTLPETPLPATGELSGVTVRVNV